MKNMISFQRAAELFPAKLKEKLFLLPSRYAGAVREIRVYDGAPLLLLTDDGLRCVAEDGMLLSFFGGGCLSADARDMKMILLNAAGASVYQYEKELANGYITCPDGIRIGICCSSADKGVSLDRLTSINIRIPYEEEFPCPVPEVLLTDGGVLIAGAPGSGKTTVLKACCRFLCDTSRGRIKRLSIVDSRGELSCFSCGEKKYAADIIACADKAAGILRALRLMSPEYIVCDETGDVRETDSMLEGMNSGVRFITAMHAGSTGELVRREQFARLCFAGVFKHVVMLSAEAPGTVADIWKREELENEICRYYPFVHRCSYERF